MTTTETTQSTQPTPSMPTTQSTPSTQSTQPAQSSQASRTSASRRPRHPLLGATRLINPLIMALAGTRVLPLYGVLEHRGRRSGKLFRTPVVVRPTQDGFVVPMPWGEGTDWFRNVRAAGGCVIRWRGREYPMVQPEVIEASAARAVFGATQWTAMARFGIDRCLHLRHQG